MVWHHMSYPFHLLYDSLRVYQPRLLRDSPTYDLLLQQLSILCICSCQSNVRTHTQYVEQDTCGVDTQSLP